MTCEGEMDYTRIGGGWPFFGVVAAIERRSSSGTPAEKAGWGRIHVTVMPAEHARYLGQVSQQGAATLPQALAAVGRIWRRL